MEYQPVHLSSNQSLSDICQMTGCGMSSGERRGGGDECKVTILRLNM